ncbi:response regulator [Spirosoma panaciterrae]|uniref:response regulator n=1 Tax=Spirosoma panaciterrae TaxID=496058 RepID=UPI0003732ECB|nr:response regulator [Spirosoma panaciterrae]
MRLLYLVVLYSLLLSSSFAQLKGWQELTISDGLSQGMIYDLKQDHKGFIWIATKDGLNRYDGYTFTVFTHDTYNPYSLSSNACSSLLVDRHGRLWIGTLNSGLNLYDGRTQRFYHIDMSGPASADAGNYEISLLTEDPDGNIWVGTSRNKLIKITLEGSLKTGFPWQANATSEVKITQLSFPLYGVNRGSAPTRIGFHRDGQAMVSMAKELYALNWRQPQQTGFSRINRLGALATLFQATPDSQKPEIWFGFSDDTLVGWNQTQRKAIRLPPTENFNVYLNRLDSHTLAVATPNFLWIMSPAQFYAQDSLSARNAFARLPPNIFAVTKILVDKTGNIWVGTAGYGLRKFNPHIKPFQSYLSNTSLSYLFQDRQGQIYVRNQFDYGRLDRASNRWRPFLNKGNLGPNGRLRYLMQDRQGFFWGALVDNQGNSSTHQLIKFSEQWQRLDTYTLPTGTAFGDYGNQIREDKAGHLWVGATNGKLLKFDPATRLFAVFSYQKWLGKQAAEVETYSLYFDTLGTGWIGTQNGLIRVDHPQTTPAFSIYKNDRATPGSLSNDFVSSSIDDPIAPLRYLWISTKGGGLDQLDKQTGQFRHFTETQGLPNKVVYGILTDAFNNLWMSTNRGLAQFNPQTLKFRKYTKADGLQDDEFNTGSFLKIQSGELLFGGVNGLTAFRPKEVMATTTDSPPRVHIVGLKINNTVATVGAADGLLPETIEQTRQLNLSHTQNLITLEFALMDYTNPAKNQYRYRLKGIDPGWVESGTHRFANYAQLPAGVYTFEVEGSADGERWSQPVRLHIQIHPPYYLSWWAYLFYSVVVLLIGWQLYRFQKQRWLLQQQVAYEQREAYRLAELDALKTQFFTNISHEFRTPLTLILAPLADLKQRFRTEKVVPLTEPVVTLMEQNSNRLLGLVNQLLDLGKLEAGQLKATLQPGDVAVFLSTLASSFSALAQRRQIQFSLIQQYPHVQASFDHDKLEKIVTNLLSNAFKFTPDGKPIRVQVDYPQLGSTTELVIKVEDTGIGIAPADLALIFKRFYQASHFYEGTGIGLSLVKELVKVLGGTIVVSSQEGVGTHFTVRLPLITHPSQSVPTDQRLSNSVEDGKHSHLLADTFLSAPATDTLLLIIDDNPAIRAYVRTVFEGDYQVLEAEDGQDGLEKATMSLPNLIICDLLMPRLDGFEFCRLLKNQETTSHIPVVMLTAKATAQDRIEGFDLGADDYLTKPFNPAELKARVRNLLKKQAQWQQYYSGESGRANDGLPEPALSEKEAVFLAKAHARVMAHLADRNFGVETFSHEMNMSQSQLVRKLKALTGQTAVEYVRTVRLEQAADRLRQKQGSVSEIAHQVGFESLAYFTRMFQERFGVLPSAYE